MFCYLLQELVGNTAEQRNWRGIAIALLVIVVVCALIVTAVILVTPMVDEDLGELFTLDDYFDKNYKPKTFHSTWISDDKFLYRNEEGALYAYDCTKNATTLIMDNTTFRQFDTPHFTLSADRQYVLLKYDLAQVFRHSTIASYVVYNINTKDPYDLKGPQGDDKIQYVTWAPKGHALIFIQNNNIFYKSDVQAVPVIIADGGIPGEIYNGVPDWVYEEEILSTDNAMWWSPNATFVAYAVINDTRVPKYYYQIYGNLDSAYGELASIAYPKPGFPNPTINIKIVNVLNKKTVEIEPPLSFKNIEHYFTSVIWKDDQSIIVSWLNRPQNQSIVTICDVSGTCKESTREDGHGGWVSMTGAPIVSRDGLRYFMILPQKDADAGYFNHVAMLEKKVELMIFLTHHRWEVTKILAYDQELKLVYYIGTGGDPRHRHLYRSSLSHDKTPCLEFVGQVLTSYVAEIFQHFVFSVYFSVNLEHHSTCLTCSLNSDCQYVSATFSSSTRYYLLNCLGPGVPYTTLRSVAGAQGKLNGYLSFLVATMENNTMLREKLSKKALPRVEYVQIEVDKGYKIWGKMLLPPVLKKDEITKYPVVLHVYGGPGSQRVTEKFSIGWETYLTSSQEMIYVYADGRGSGGRGQKFLHQIYRRFGTVEVDDAIAAGKHFSKLHYVDDKKVAIWGWSFGGFVAASALGKQTDTFQCGISVAPVTDWIYYDSVYTERYMGLPRADDNLQGYKDANVSKNVENFKNSNFLLIHGTGDDNVHFQNSAQLMKALTEKDVYYRTQLYTDKHHGLLGGNTRHHFYETMEDFLFECFKGYSQKHGKEPQPVEKKPQTL
ncbi:hypothetical protein LOTGIDRAFT_226274 [Lottia gigantea]|uniref:Uncharacterized protein n=1 Tax=Lottia gigantea TaxID=225164 RepID=V4CBG8_LOTGI|nr:hypothetical protein LOTGIDRAFT_226274 [Lottia gigantea]ESO99209.1 hypothetical protein LOTGIDRAFT_226274 [Lottia gigantea]